MIDKLAVNILLNRPRLSVHRPTMHDLLERYKTYFKTINRSRRFTNDVPWWTASFDLCRLFVTRANEKQVVDTLYRKHADYGGRSLIICGPYGIAVRSIDKICRIDNIEKMLDESPNFESVLDNYEDLFNYSILGYLITTGGVK